MNTIYILVGINSALILTLGVCIYVFYKKAKFWRNETAAYIHTLAIVESMDVIPETILVVNEKKKVIYANATVETMFGFIEKELLEKSLNELLPATVVKDIESSMIVDDKQIISAFCTYKNIESRVIPLEITVSKNSKKSNAVWWTIVLKDISHRKQNDDTVKKVISDLTQLKSVYVKGEKLARVGFYLMNTLTGMIDIKTQGFVSMFGIDSNNPSDYLDRVVKADKVKVAEALSSVVSSREGYEIEYNIGNTDGTNCLVRSRTEPVKDEEGVITHIVGSLLLLNKEKPNWI